MCSLMSASQVIGKGLRAVALNDSNDGLGVSVDGMLGRGFTMLKIAVLEDMLFAPWVRKCDVSKTRDAVKGVRRMTAIKQWEDMG